jgi:hypothetical protein
MKKTENEKIVELQQTQETEVNVETEAKTGGFREFVKANKKKIIKGVLITLGVGAGAFIVSKIIKNTPVNAIDILEKPADIITEIGEAAEQIGATVTSF